MCVSDVGPSRDDGLPNGLPERFGDLGNGLVEPDERCDEYGDEERAGIDCARMVKSAAGAVVERKRRCCE